jgi:hypothetical protein
MSDQYVQVQPDSTGKKVDVSELTVGSNTVERQRIVLADNTTAASFASITNSALQVQEIANLMQNYTPATGYTSIDTVNGPTSQLQLDPERHLMIRGPVLTDEGSKRDDFGEEGSWIVGLTGTVTVVTGSKAVVGAGTSFTTQVEEHDYFKVTSDTETYWTQIQSVTDDTHLVLESGYAGTSASGVAGSYTDWPSITTGSGMSVTEAASLLTIATGTTSGGQEILYHNFDYLPLTMITRCYVSQAIANQEFGFGFADTPSSPGHFVKVTFSGTDASKVTFATGCTSNAAYQQSTVYTIPNGVFTSYNTFKIDLSSDKATLTINDITVAVYTYHLPYTYTKMSAYMYAKNTDTAGSNSNFVFDWVQLNNYDELSITTRNPLDTNTTITTKTGLGQAPWFATITPTQRLRVSGETINIFTENFDYIALDPNKWNPSIASGAGNYSYNSGNYQLNTNTSATSSISISSVPTFSPGGLNFYILSMPIKVEASPVITNAHRFWGVGLPPTTTPTAAAPLSNAIGFEIDTTGSLNAVVWSNGSKIFTQAMVLPTDGQYHRYRIAYRVDQVNFYIDMFDVPQARSQYNIPNNLQLPIRLHVINGTSPGTAPTLQVMAISLADTGNNFIQIADGTYPQRKTTVTPTGNLQVSITDGLTSTQNKAYVDSSGALNVNVTTDIDSLKTGNTFTLEHLAHDPTYPTYIKFDRYGKQLGGQSVPVTLASDDIVPILPSISAPTAGVIDGGAATNYVGPVAMQGYTACLIEVQGPLIAGGAFAAFSCSLRIDAAIDDSLNGPWFNVAATNLGTGAIITGAQAVTTGTYAWLAYVPGFQYLRVFCTAYTSGQALVKITRLGVTSNTLPTAVTVSGNAAVGAALSGNPLPIVGMDGTTNNYLRGLTITPPTTLYNLYPNTTIANQNPPLTGQTTSQPNVIILGGTDGIYVPATNQTATNAAALGNARALLTDTAGVLQVNDTALALLRVEVRESNALLVQILNELDDYQTLADHVPAMRASINNFNSVISQSTIMASNNVQSGQVKLTQTAAVLPFQSGRRVTVQASYNNATNNSTIFIGEPGQEYLELQAGDKQTLIISNSSLLSAYASGNQPALLNFLVEV